MTEAVVILLALVAAFVWVQYWLPRRR